jgi:hypothetical protein
VAAPRERLALELATAAINAPEGLTARRLDLPATPSNAQVVGLLGGGGCAARRGTV